MWRTVRERLGNRLSAKYVIRYLIIALFFSILMFLSAGIYRLIKWNAYIWFPEYVSMQLSSNEAVPDNQKHIIFTFVDHYEPGYEKEEAFSKHTAWMKDYRAATEGRTDSFGNRIKYTWYYPFDQKNDQMLVSLTEAVNQGLGEIEFHWHHPPSDNERFPGQLREAVDWFNKFGALMTCGDEVKTAFSFIHGNWALDDSAVADDGKRFCGVTREIDILHAQGCYADLTFSTIATEAQPSNKINSIYYVTDDDNRKSYDDGTLVKVGHVVNDKFMMIQGPLSISPTKLWRIEYGALEEYARPSIDRINEWIDANIHVSGRPEWVFVKLYSHGIQSPSIMKEHFGNLLADIAAVSKRRGFKYHYMSARELFNVVKAAEAGKTGNPESYRDFIVPKPCNRYFHTKVPVRITGFVDGNVIYEAI